MVYDTEHHLTGLSLLTDKWVPGLEGAEAIAQIKKEIPIMLDKAITKLKKPKS